MSDIESLGQAEHVNPEPYTGPPLPDEKGIYTLEIGKHTVKVASLNGAQVNASNRVSPSVDDELGKSKDRALYAVREIDGQPYGPPNSRPAAQAQYDAIAAKFSANEYDYFFLAYTDATRDSELEAKAKNTLDRLRLVSP